MTFDRYLQGWILSEKMAVKQRGGTSKCGWEWTVQVAIGTCFYSGLQEIVLGVAWNMQSDEFYSLSERFVAARQRPVHERFVAPMLRPLGIRFVAVTKRPLGEWFFAVMLRPLGERYVTVMLQPVGERYVAVLLRPLGYTIGCSYNATSWCMICCSDAATCWWTTRCSDSATSGYTIRCSDNVTSWCMIGFSDNATSWWTIRCNDAAASGCTIFCSNARSVGCMIRCSDTASSVCTISCSEAATPGLKVGCGLIVTSDRMVHCGEAATSGRMIREVLAGSKWILLDDYEGITNFKNMLWWFSLRCMCLFSCFSLPLWLFDASQEKIFPSVKLHVVVTIWEECWTFRASCRFFSSLLITSQMLWNFILKTPGLNLFPAVWWGAELPLLFFHPVLFLSSPSGCLGMITTNSVISVFFKDKHLAIIYSKSNIINISSCQ